MELTARILNIISSLFFLAGGAWSDLLLIRTFLTCAYAFLFAFHFAIDQQFTEQYVVAFVSLYLHGSSAVRLLIDEMPVHLGDNEHEMLWRYFYRHSGVTKLLFKKHIGHRFEIKSFEENEQLDPENYFYIIIEGSVRLNVEMDGHNSQFLLRSGYACGAKHLHSCMTSPMLSIQMQKLEAYAITKCKLYCCTAKNMKEFTTCRAVKDASQGLLTAVLSDIAVKHFFMINSQDGEMKVDIENQALLERENDEMSPLFQPLQDFERPKPYLAGGARTTKDIMHHFVHLLRRRLLLPWPLSSWIPGLRQIGSLPIPMCKSPTHQFDVKMISSTVELTDETE